ncbi:MAG: hypothetical protein HQM12_22645 [SAR324 cluster bacterium]|nr:hypothetical protein [SAR324 cluster bacterium]
MLINKCEQWRKTKEIDRNELRVLENTTLSLAEDLGIRSLCLFIGGKLHGFQLYQLSHDGRYFILNHLKVSHAFRFMIPYMELEIGKKAEECGVYYLNFEMDLDVPGLRTSKSELKPSGYFKKFSISFL